VYKTWASIDDCDFNGHLSNSSYATTLDAARLKTAVASFPFFFGAGGRMALGATQYTFIREIPMSMPYEVQLCTVGWDNKWVRNLSLKTKNLTGVT
jgi:acyl-CoA thioesterase FadM